MHTPLDLAEKKEIIKKTGISKNFFILRVFGMALIFRKLFNQPCVLFNLEPIDNKTVLMEKQLHPVNIYIEFLSFPDASLPFWLLRDI